MDSIDFHALALEVEDALFDADLKPSELRMARLIVKLSLRWSRTTTPHMLQKDFGLLIGMRETHVAETLGWLLGKKIILLERNPSGAGCFYRPNTDPRTWIVDELVTPQAKARERELMGQDYIEFWPLGAIRAGDPAVALRDAEVEVRAENLRNSEVTKFVSPAASSEGPRPDWQTSGIRKSPIAIGRAKSSPITGTGGITGNRPARAGSFLEEQIGRLERAIGEENVRRYLPWWRKYAGESPQHANALRETLDDYVTNRESVTHPDRWIVKTFQNKIRAIRNAVHLLLT